MKRTSPDGDSNLSAPSPPTTASASKRVKLVNFEPVRLPSISTAAQMDTCVMALQHSKISEKIKHRIRIENELRSRIQSLHQRQIQADQTLCSVNRYWNQFDDEIRLLLQRFDAEVSVQSEQNSWMIYQSEAVTSFVAKLSQWDQTEMEESLQTRVEFSRRAVQKLVQTYDRLLQRNDKITSLIQKLTGDKAAGADADHKDHIKTEIGEQVSADGETKIETKPPSSPDAEDTDGDDKSLLSKELVDQCTELQSENSRLQQLLTHLQADCSQLKLKVAQSDDVIEAAEARVEEMQSKLSDAEFELENSMERENKLQYRLHDVSRQLQDTQERLAQHNSKAGQTDDSDPDAMASVSKNKLDEMTAELEIERESANTRLQELHEMNDKYTQAQGRIAKLELELQHVPADVIKSSVEYKSLLSHFNVLHSDATRMRARLEETVKHLHTVKAEHFKQIEQMESEELMAQNQLKQETLKLQDQLNQIRREYEMLRLEFEQNLSANEQSGPVNREMRKFLDSCRNQNELLMQEVKRFKKKWQEAVSTIARMQRELDAEKKQRENSLMIDLGLGGKEEAGSDKQSPGQPSKDDDADLGTPPEEAPAEASIEEKLERAKKLLEFYRARSEQLQSRLTQLRQGPDARDKTALQQENKRLEAELRKLANMDKKDKCRFYSDEAHKRIKYLEAETDKLRKEAACSKQFEDELLSEIEVTGQAFEDMKEQNTRLLAELKEKDEASFKHMSERIRSNQQQKKLKEEKDLIEEQVGALQNQIEAQHVVVRNLEEKERLLQQHGVFLQKEVNARQQASDSNKRKAQEFAQSSTDLRLQLEKTQAQLAEAQQAVVAKASAKEDPAFKIRRLQEDITSMKRRVDRAKRFERGKQVDEVFLEEIKQLKDDLTCTSCKVNRKDAILSKCHHVFCMTCLKARFDQRRRKCPKCNGAFGANDFHRIYLY